MSAQDPVDRDGTPGHDETFLSRWSRRKARSRAAEPAPVEQALVEPAVAATVAATPVANPTVQPPTAPARTTEPPTGEAPAAQPPAIELPDLDLLGEDSDYSAFLTAGVDADLRRKALRKLFSSPKFNVFDGLDTYRDDFTAFPALGSVVTADMHHHVERLAKKAAQIVDQQTAPAASPEPVAATAPVAATTASATTATDAAAAPEAPAVEPPTAPDEENHDTAS